MHNMFHPNVDDDPYNKILNFYFHDIHAKPVQLSLHIPSRILHIRALCSGLFRVKQNLIYVLDSLQRFEDSEWGIYEDKVAHELTAGTIILAGILDGLIMCYLFHSPTLIHRSTSFCTTAFQRPDLQKIQQSIKDLKSISNSASSRHANFWTISDFWKHYYPYLPRPSNFTLQRVRDFAVNIGDGNLTGPILFDLIVPAFNGACDIALAIAAEEGLESKYTQPIATKLRWGATPP